MSGKKKHRTADEFLQYLRGDHSNQERHSFEHGMETDPFEKEALEGLEGLTPGEAETDILSLHARLRKRLARRRRIAIYSAAATVASLLIIGTIFIQIYDISPQSADETLPEKELPMISQEQGEVEETIAEVGESMAKVGESKAKVEESQAEEGEMKVSESALKKAPDIPAPEPAKEELFEMVAEDEVQLYAAEPESEEQIVADEEEIISVEAAPVQESIAMAPVAKSVDKQEKRRSEGTRHTRMKREKSGGRQMEAAGKEFDQVSGVVVSAEDMEPLPGANVAVKGGDTGVVADMQGQFSLPADQDASTTLIASYIGMETSEYPVTVGSAVELVMEPDMASLDEVVVVGYPKGGVTEYDKSATVAEPSIGYSAFKQYIKDNIRFPDSDPETTRALVILQFIISANGEISDIKPLRSPGPDFTDEATRLLMEGPSWNPASNTLGTTDEEVRLRIVFKKYVSTGGETN